MAAWMYANYNEVASIVLTGGPCAGKTSILNYLREYLLKMGYIPLVIGETATRLQQSGVKPCDGYIDLIEFEKFLLEIQLSEEKAYRSVAWQIARNTKRKVIILQDRGVLDIAAYIGLEELIKILQVSCVQTYMAAIHLVTAADGAEHAYTTANNPMRRETADEAREKDQLTYEAYINGMPEGRVFRIQNRGSFETKKLDTINVLRMVLGLQPIGEKQSKYIVDFGTVGTLKQRYNGTELYIEQTYLQGTEGDTERRIRKISDGNRHFYSISNTTYDIKYRERIKTEKMLSEGEYASLLQQASPFYTPIKKTRTCFMIGEIYVEIDVFDSPKLSYGILEVKSFEPLDTSTIKKISALGITDVTGDPSYINKEIARK